MSFKLLHADGTELGTYAPRTRVALTSVRATFIPPLSLARIEHGCFLKRQFPIKSLIITLRSPTFGLDRALIVDQGLVNDGPIETVVFNVSDQRVRIEKGEVVAWLMEI